jgi:hypothetical protein
MKLPETYIERVYKDDKITLGRFWFESETVYTMELPWVHNKPSISCIPEGSYVVEKTYSPRFKKDMYLIKDVPGRSGIRFHSANYVFQLEGCVALGLEKQDINGDGIINIVNSKKAIALMNDTLPDKFILDIIWRIKT